MTHHLTAVGIVALALVLVIAARAFDQRGAVAPVAVVVGPADAHPVAPPEPPEPMLAELLAVEAPGDPGRATALLRRGLERARNGDAVGAIGAFSEAAEVLPVMADWTYALAADAAARVGDTLAVREWHTLVDPWFVREWGWRAVVRALESAGELDAAADAAERAAGELTSPARQAAAWIRAAELRLLRGETDRARADLRRAMELAPGSTAAVDAARLLSTLTGLDARDRLEIGRIYLRHGNVDRGMAGVDAFLSAGAGTPEERATARLEVGRALFRAGRHAEAERRLLALSGAADVPSDVAAEALFIAGRAQFRRGRTDAARSTFHRTAERFPREAAAADALFILADLEHDRGSLPAASELYRRSWLIRPARADAGITAMRLGGIAYLESDYREAVAVFQEYRRHHPTGRHFQQASFWAARALLRLGRDDEARRLLVETWEADPFSYYGLRAADLLDGPPRPPLLAESPLTPYAVRQEVDRVVLRMDILEELDLTDALALEQERARLHLETRAGGLHALAEEYNRGGRTFEGILLGREIHRATRVWSPRLLRIVYPFPYRELVEREARRNDLDPFLVAGLIRQESMWRPSVASPAGAIGLMQIMPATGRALARRVGISGFQPASLRQPEMNLRLGTLYLSDLLRRYDGSVVEALAAYNAGPSRVTRWSTYPEFRERELFAERIPFAETRDYVRIVQQNARLYAALYGDGGTLFFSE